MTYLHQEYDIINKRVIDTFPNRTKLLRMTSDEAVGLIENDSLDFVFIDGLHTYDQVKKDCINFFPKVKKGGVFAGHDFTIIDDVNRAVKEFRDSVDPSIEIKTTNYDVWYWIKN